MAAGGKLHDGNCLALDEFGKFDLKGIAAPLRAEEREPFGRFAKADGLMGFDLFRFLFHESQTFCRAE